jgi:hypothetical protein
MAIDDVSDLSRRVQYTSGAGQTTFTYPFRIFDEGDLDVYVGDVQYTPGTMYSVTGVDNDLGGSVIFTTGLSAGAIVTIYSDTAIDRDTDYQQNGPWTSARLNSELDKFMVISQELRAKISRAIRGSILGNTVAEMPSAADRASKYLYFNASGDPTVVTGDASQPLTHSVYLVYPINGQTVVTVPATYTQGAYNLSVYLNGVKQVVGVDYTETSTTSITLTNPATLGDVIDFSIGEVFDVTLVRTGREEQSFTGLTTPVITLTTVSYTPGAHEVDVFFNGALLATADYTETNSATITLGFTPVASDQFRVIVGRPVNVTNVSRSSVGAALYPQTAAEIATGVIPTDYAYPPGDVRRYGAVGDGVADDSMAIQSAINVAQINAGTVFFPSGVYAHASQLLVTVACTLRGDSRPGPRVYANPAGVYGGAELVYTGSATTSTDPASFAINVTAGAIGSEGNANVIIERLGISWTDVNAGGVYVQGSSEVTITENWFCGGKVGADADTLTGFSIYARDMIIGRITKNRFNYVAYGIIADDYFNEVEILDNDFEYVTTLAIGVYAVTNTSIRSTIAGNNFIGNGAVPCDNAIKLSGDVQQVTVRENTFEAVRGHTITIDSVNPLTAAVLAGKPIGISVVDNAFIACGGLLAGSNCVSIQTGDYVSVVRNTVKSATGPMTAVVGVSATATNVTIAGNGQDAVPALWSGNPPTIIDCGLYRSLPFDSSESTHSAWTNDNLGACWVNNSTSGALQRAPRYWNGARGASILTGGSRIDTTSDATPEVRGISALMVNPAAPYTITDFDEGYTGQSVIVYNQSANNVTIDCTGTDILSVSGANITLGLAAWRRFELLDGTTWVEA